MDVIHEELRPKGSNIHSMKTNKQRSRKLKSNIFVKHELEIGSCLAILGLVNYLCFYV